MTYRGKNVLGISVDGSSGAENVFYVDGVDTTSMYNGLNNQNLRVETVQEFQLKTAGYEAEFGGAMGGVLSIRTRSGSNDFHGSVLWYGSGSALAGAPGKRLRLDPSRTVDVAQYVFDPEDDEVINEFGFTLGGPIWRDRIWFFGALLPQVRNRMRSVTFTSGETGVFSRRDRLHSTTAKIDFQPAEIVRLMASYVSDRSKWKGGLPGLDGTSNPNYEWAEEGFEHPGYTVTGAMTITPSPVSIVDARWGLNAIQTEQLLEPNQVRHRFLQSPGLIGYAPDDPLYRPRGFYSIGHAASFNTSQDFQKKSTLSLTGSYLATLGGQQHDLRFGWQFNGLAHDVNDSYKFDPREPTMRPNSACGNRSETIGLRTSRMCIPGFTGSIRVWEAPTRTDASLPTRTAISISGSSATTPAATGSMDRWAPTERTSSRSIGWSSLRGTWW